MDDAVYADMIQLNVSRQQLGLLLEGIDLLLTKKRGPLMREACRLRVMLCEEIAAAREGDDEE